MSISVIPLTGGVKRSVTYPLGANLSILLDKETKGTRYLSLIVNTMKRGLTLKPVHSHKNIEEIIFVLSGKGKVWIDGEIATINKGDSALFPENSKHSIKNTGRQPLRLLCCLSSSNYRQEGLYETFESIDF